MFRYSDSRVLVLAPHTDDGELGCGGTIAKYLENDVDVYVIVFSSCEQSVPEGFSKDILKTEFYDSMQKLGVPRDHLDILDFQVRYFPEHRQAILEKMVKLAADIQPDTVFIPSPHDIHQDHSTVAQEAMRAFKKKKLLGYELPWNNYTFDNQTFSILDERHVDKKIEALSCYVTQRSRDYFKRDYLSAIARTHGVQIGAKYAEVFETIRWTF